MFDIESITSHINPGDFDDYFDESYLPRIAYIRREKGYNVDWYIRRGSLRVDSDYIIPTSGNIWNFKKLLSVTNFLNNDGIISLPSILGVVNKVTLTNIAEHYEQRNEDMFYDGFTRKFTTSDKDLDKYINANHRKNNETMLEIEKEYPEFKGYLSLMKRGRKPKGIDVGDFGKTYANISNDFNHRVFGSILAGEPYIWIYVEHIYSTKQTRK